MFAAFAMFAMVSCGGQQKKAEEVAAEEAQACVECVEACCEECTEVKECCGEECPNVEECCGECAEAEVVEVVAE